MAGCRAAAILGALEALAERLAPLLDPGPWAARPHTGDHLGVEAAASPTRALTPPRHHAPTLLGAAGGSRPLSHARGVDAYHPGPRRGLPSQA